MFLSVVIPDSPLRRPCYRIDGWSKAGCQGRRLPSEVLYSFTTAAGYRGGVGAGLWGGGGGVTYGLDLVVFSGGSWGLLSASVLNRCPYDLLTLARNWL